MTPDELDAFWATWHDWYRTQPETTPLLTDDDREPDHQDDTDDWRHAQTQYERHLDRTGGSR